MSIDSATSESFQSSNGGNDLDTFDSRPPSDQISSFLNLPPPQPPRNVFDPFPSYQTNSLLSDLDASSWPLPHPIPPQPPSSTPPRSSKKRARASRRAPTTVLTTDTSNFRAMVQEFTGIPAPPFGTSSVFSSPRIDLFHQPSMPGFVLRPFAQKRQATGLPGISSNTLRASSSSGLFQWPGTGGYGGGELGSVIAGASSSAEADSKQTAEAAARGEGGMDAWQLSSD